MHVLTENRPVLQTKTFNHLFSKVQNLFQQMFFSPPFFALSTGADPGQDMTPGGGGATNPKMVVWNNGFCGCRNFVLGIWQGEIFLFDPMYLCSKYSEFRGEFKNG